MLCIVKFGGSVITNKEGFKEIDWNNLRRLSRELKAWKGKLILVHGGGSFGHPLASRYELAEGYREKRQLHGFALTRKAMEELNQAVVAALLEQGFNAIAMQSSAIFTCNNRRISEQFFEPIRRALEFNLLPVLYGDVVFDNKLGFCILSGDQICVRLANEFGAKLLVFCTEVDGVFDRPPYETGAKLIRELKREQLVRAEGRERDVTGGMKGKLEELKGLKKGTITWIINGRIRGRLKKVLEGRKVVGTLIK